MKWILIYQLDKKYFLNFEDFSHFFLIPPHSPLSLSLSWLLPFLPSLTPRILFLAISLLTLPASCAISLSIYLYLPLSSEFISTRFSFSGRTPLMLAATNGFYDILVLLVNEGASLDLEAGGKHVSVT